MAGKTDALGFVFKASNGGAESEGDKHKHYSTVRITPLLQQTGERFKHKFIYSLQLYFLASMHGMKKSSPYFLFAQTRVVDISQSEIDFLTMIVYL